MTGASRNFGVEAPDPEVKSKLPQARANCGNFEAAAVGSIIRLVANGRRSPRYPDILLGPFRRLPAWDFLFWQARHLEERRCLEIGRAKPFLIEFPNVGRSKKAAQSAIDDQPEILVPSLQGDGERFVGEQAVENHKITA